MTLVSPWIAFTILAALMQAVRTAGQKQLTSSVTPMSSTLIRYVFGLPFAIIYLIYITRADLPAVVADALGNDRFLLFALAAAVAQIMATVLLVKLFSFRNFTVGTSLAKTEAVQAAVFGTVLFGMPLSLLGWLAVAVGFLGIYIVSMPSGEQRWEPRTVLLGTLSGTAFALTSLWIRQASLSLDHGVLTSSAMTLVFLVSVQSLICTAYTVLREPDQFPAIGKRLGLAGFVGLTSALGSIGWFTAMTYQNPALVKSLGQVEFIFTLLLTTLFFKERVTARELLGVAAIVCSVILILQA
ncbi:DMT family transporter [Granulosicoccus sp. 3-233]|uniref:DMT family transporter n=1 Tax=Granulosicoccus sp. 3-233 TaxID=3417969 RepID=UPI003D32E1D3